MKQREWTVIDVIAVIGAVIMVVLMIITVFVAVWNIVPVARNSTDSQTVRSGLHLYKDHGTGCEYLRSSNGSITPRMDRNGKQVCSNDYD